MNPCAFFRKYNLVVNYIKSRNILIMEVWEKMNKRILTFLIVGLLYYLENRGRQICEWNTKLILC